MNSFDIIIMRFDLQDKEISGLDKRLDRAEQWQEKADEKFTLLIEKLDGGEEKTDARISRLEEQNREIRAEIKAVNDSVKYFADRQEFQISTFSHVIYWGFALIALLITIAPALWAALARIARPGFTLEDVRKLIQEEHENNNKGVKVS